MKQVTNRPVGRSGARAGAGVLVVLAVSFLLAACGGTGFEQTWVEPASVEPLQRIAVIGVAADTTVRTLFEDNFARRLQIRGNDAKAGHVIIPQSMRGKVAEIRQKLAADKFDGVLVTRLASADEVLTSIGAVDVDGTMQAIPPAPAGSGDSAKARLRTSLYRLSDGKLLWDAVTATSKGSSLKEGVAAFSSTVARELAVMGLVR